MRSLGFPTPVVGSIWISEGDTTLREGGTKEEGEEYEPYSNFAEHSLESNRMRFGILPIISRVRNEKVRAAAQDLYYLDRDMVLLEASTWAGDRIYGGDDPVLIQERRLPQFIGMVGKLLRDESIDDVDFPEITFANGDGYLIGDGRRDG
jgi:hypothetical protein